MIHFSLWPQSLVYLLNSWPPEIVLLGMLGFCYTVLLLMLRLFGREGLFVYSAIAAIAANIQVLKGIKISFYSEPMALGTIVFSSIYFCGDILTECYGVHTARRNVALSFAATLIMTGLMILTMGLKPLDWVSYGTAYQPLYESHLHIKALFLPSVAIFTASLIAYLVSHLLNITLFNGLKILTQGRNLWLRTGGASLVAMFIDTVVFSTLAWIVFNPHPIGWHELWFTYILATYILRVLIAFVNTLIIYLAKAVAV